MSKELRVYMPGDVLFHEGDPSGGLYFIQSGKVDVFKVRSETEVVLGVLGAGEILGTLTVFNGEPRTASARAASRVEVQYMSSTSLTQGMSKIPVWAVAIIKDTVARLKHVDDLLVQSSLNEKRLRQEVGGILHHAAQFANFCALMMRLACKEEDGVTVFPLKGISARAEPVLNLRAEYIETILAVFVKAGLLKPVSDKKWGEMIREPRPKVYEDFGTFAYRVAKKGTADFVPQKFAKWVGAMVRLRKKSPEKPSYTMAEFVDLVSKESGRSVPPEMIEFFKKNGLIRIQNNQVSFEADSLQRRLVFEATCQELLDADTSLPDKSFQAPD